MLYYPWFDEQADLLGGYETYEQHYSHVKNIVQANDTKYTKEDIEGMDIEDNGPPEQESRMQSVAEGSEQLTEVSQRDL